MERCASLCPSFSSGRPETGTGIHCRAPGRAGSPEMAHEVLRYLDELGLRHAVALSWPVAGEPGPGPDALAGSGDVAQLTLRPDVAAAWAPECDTTGLADIIRERYGADARNLEREILLAMLLAPVPLPFPSAAELRAAVRVKTHTVTAARQTELAFDTEHAERPAGYWTYDETRGFTVLPGRPLIDALRRATQPGASGKRYSFSCYRATEYVTLLGIAQTLAEFNPALLAGLQRQWERRAIMSGEFHDVFLREYGSMESPLPPRYYVPGDRLWFRNPDEPSSNVEGYEGSWVFYLGGGLFTNFWQHDAPFTLTSKCVEIYHWRHGLCRDGDGIVRMDEDVVQARVTASMADPRAVRDILARMLRLREPRGVYVDGGCIDTTRECVRWLCPGTAELVLPQG